MMFRVDNLKAMYIFIDEFEFATGLFLKQYKANIFLSILYDLFTFTSTERQYGIYNMKLLSIV